MIFYPPFSQVDEILIVNADPDQVYFLSESLVNQGYSVKNALNWLDAQAKLQIKTPNLILIDYSKNIEEISSIINFFQDNEMAFIFLIQSEEISSLTQFEINDNFELIKKPFLLEELLIRIKKHLSFIKNRSYLQVTIQQLEQEIQSRCQVETKLEILNISLQETTKQLRNFSRFDNLTYLPNRSYFDEYLLREWQRLAREKLPLSLILCDLDRFRSYNDDNGFHGGDLCLKKISETITCAVKRPADFVARYSGEEFAVILPHTDQGGALEVAKLIRAKIKELEIPHSKSKISPYLTVSLGVATRIPVPDLPPDPLITLAEEALGEAKRQGCDRIGMRVHWR